MFDLLRLQTSPGLEECMQSRPPLQLDLTGPKPTTYDPPTTLPWETSSPRYTMRPKTQPERGKATTVHTLSDKYGEQGMVRWWECSPCTCVAQAQNPGVNTICGLSLLLALSFALRRFSPGTLVLLSLQNQHFQIPFRPGMVDEEPL